ncbi:hypothetical protein BD410DRAFT_842959 [Rickenella mellea]|uniref:Uncharacterized protein n=1 Tax=Rickenella mellea TaxID=50990 RepID=A0A4Y7PTG8_9AGAM|nr:hypothetical protein BD410DRAFT_842959 [Rickenella mellea]
MPQLEEAPRRTWLQWTPAMRARTMSLDRNVSGMSMTARMGCTSVLRRISCDGLASVRLGETVGLVIIENYAPGLISAQQLVRWRRKRRRGREREVVEERRVTKGTFTTSTNPSVDTTASAASLVEPSIRSLPTRPRPAPLPAQVREVFATAVGVFKFLGYVCETDKQESGIDSPDAERWFFGGGVPLGVGLGVRASTGGILDARKCRGGVEQSKSGRVLTSWRKRRTFVEKKGKL